ncbi:MAG: hypothetical protein OXD36_13760 [Rhodobacter sp.]|nr:hypothetical protein [Rhodobacter sp.]
MKVPVTATHTCEDGSTATGMGADQDAAEAAAEANCPKPEMPTASLPSGLGPQQLYKLAAATGDDSREWLETASSVPFEISESANGLVKKAAENGGQGWKKALNAQVRAISSTAPNDYAASLNGQTVEHATVGGDEITFDNTVARYASRATVKFKGIVGMAYCGAELGTACTSAKSGDGARLTGDWYFIPSASEAGKRWSAKGSGFESVGWAEYGYWLAEDSDDGWQLHRLIARKGPAYTIAGTGLSTAGSAKYSGEAHGVSALAPSGDTPARHGVFDATVNLEAKFATAPQIKGTIENFRGGAVNTDWKLSLTAGNITDSGAVVDPDDSSNNAGTTGGGEWTATPYGTDNTKRPTGVIGTFDGKFTDGAVAGVYHAN